MDPNFTAQHGAELWNETRAFSYWSPEAEAGVFLHAGRLRAHLDLWWCQLGVFLPDGSVAVDRQWCRNDDRRGVVNGNLRWLSDDPRRSFECGFDGVCELTSTEALASGVRGAGAPSVPVRWQFHASEASPTWDCFGGQGDNRFAGTSHTQQTYTAMGSLTLGDEELTFDGSVCIDHSCGVRDFRALGSHDWLIARVGGRGIHSIVVRANNGSGETQQFGRISGGENADIVGITLPPLTDLLMRERAVGVGITLDTGRTVEARLELLGNLPITINDANDNLNGFDWEDVSDPLLFAECPVRVITADGEVGYGHLERSARTRIVDRTTFAVRLEELAAACATSQC